MAELYHCYSLFSINFILYYEVKNMKNTNVIPIQKIPSILENDYQFIDLRDPYEYKKVHLTKFTNIPYEKFDLNQYYFS